MGALEGNGMSCCNFRKPRYEFTHNYRSGHVVVRLGLLEAIEEGPPQQDHSVHGGWGSGEEVFHGKFSSSLGLLCNNQYNSGIVMFGVVH